MNSLSSATPQTLATKQKTKSKAFESKLSHPTEHPFQVVCQVCQRTIFHSGKDGDVSYVVCDQCSEI
jgi:hypothetical protein